MKILVMVETECDSVWAYTVENKGVMMEPWLAPKICDDLATVGTGKGRTVVKTDQEPAIVDLLKDILRVRTDAGTALDSSRVGDSDSHGKTERAIRKLKGLIRTLRSGLEAEVGEKINIDSPSIPWLVRHAAYLITRSEVKSDGKTALQKMKGRKTTGVLTSFGETVLFKLPRTNVTIGDFEDRFSEGTWVGLTARSGEHLIANAHGVFRAGAILRKPADARWSAELLRSLRGSPKEPRPGSNSSHIPVFVKYDADGARVDKRFAPRDAPQIGPRQMYIYKQDVDLHGPTKHCQACASLQRRGHARGYAHTGVCRLRFDELVRTTERGRRRQEKADERLNEAVRRQEEGEQLPTDAPMETEGEHETQEEQQVEMPHPAAGSSDDHLRSGRKRRAEEHDEDGSTFVPTTTPVEATTAAASRGTKRKPESEDVDAIMHDSISAAILAGRHEQWVPTEEAMMVTKVLRGNRMSAVIAEIIRGKGPFGSHGCDHSRSSSFRPVGTDEVAGPPAGQHQETGGEEGIPKPISVDSEAVDTLKAHPGPW